MTENPGSGGGWLDAIEADVAELDRYETEDYGTRSGWETDVVIVAEHARRLVAVVRKIEALPMNEIGDPGDYYEDGWNDAMLAVRAVIEEASE